MLSQILKAKLILVLIISLSLFILGRDNLKAAYSETASNKITAEESIKKDAINKQDPSKKPLMLLNQDGNQIEIDSLMGKPLVMTFIYTRCPSPTKCPLIMRRMVGLQKELIDYKDKVNFAVISLDPAYDTPRVLKEYAEISNADLYNFTLLTGPQEDVDKVIRRFKIYMEEEEPGIISHSLDTFLMDPKGVIRRVFPGAFWEVEVAAEEVIKVIEEEQKAKGQKLEAQEGVLKLD